MHAMMCGCKVYTLLKQSGVYLIPYMLKICHSSILNVQTIWHACMHACGIIPCMDVLLKFEKVQLNLC